MRKEPTPITNQSLIDIIDSTFEFDSLSMVELFTLRLLVHENEPAVNIQQDLQELAHFPQRLLTSYRDEWLTYCRKQLFKACQERQFSSRARLISYLQLTQQMIQQSQHSSADYADKIQLTESLLQANNVELLESPASRKIRELIG